VSLRELYRCDLVHCFRREDRTSDLEALSRRGVTISVDNDDDISELDIAADGLASLHRRKANVKRERAIARAAARAATAPTASPARWARRRPQPLPRCHTASSCRRHGERV
jgi:hypothetical protein